MAHSDTHFEKRGWCVCYCRDCVSGVICICRQCPCKPGEHTKR